MLYNLKDSMQRNQAQVSFDHFIETGRVIEMTPKNRKRTVKQLRYVHVIIAYWGCYFGYNKEEAKVVIKRALEYTYDKKGQEFFKSLGDMDTGELADFTEKFRNWSSTEHQYYLPSPDEYRLNYTEIDNTLMSHKIYL